MINSAGNSIKNSPAKRIEKISHDSLPRGNNTTDIFENSSPVDLNLNPSSNFSEGSHAIAISRNIPNDSMGRSNTVDLIGETTPNSIREDSFSDSFREGSPIDSTRKGPIAVGNHHEELIEANSENTIAGNFSAFISLSFILVCA